MATEPIGDCRDGTNPFSRVPVPLQQKIFFFFFHSFFLLLPLAALLLPLGLKISD
jgi:hypothetical protein